MAGCREVSPRGVRPGSEGIGGADEVGPESNASPSVSSVDVDPVTASQDGWRRTRRALNRTRADLAQLAAGLYQPAVRIGDLPFMAPPGWTLDAPVPLDEIRLDWTDDPAPVRVTGAEPEAGAVLPLRTPDRRFPRYTAAIGTLDLSALFALTLTAAVLTVTVLDDDVFDELFGKTVEINAEGTLVGATAASAGLPFDDECVSRLLHEAPMTSPAACILQRAHGFRDQLLSDV